MNITTFVKEQKPNQIKVASKLTVRDFDEIEKNNFVAYVDEGNESFDVQISLDTKKNIISKSCDCSLGGDCTHQLALILFLSKKSKTTAVVKKSTRKKLSETDEILNSLETETLKNWISTLLNKNKEVAFAFKNEFGKQNTHFDKAQIQEIIQSCIESVIGKRKTIQNNEVKKVVDNLTVSLKPVLEFIFKQKIESKSFALFESIIITLQNFETNFYISSVRVARYLEAIYQQLLKHLFNTKDFESWKTQVHFFFNLVFENKTTSLLNFNLIKNIYSFSDTNAIQHQFVVQLTEEKLVKLKAKKSNETRLNIEFDSFFLKVISENNLFEKHQDLFQPRYYENDFNVLLIENLIKMREYRTAENYALAQIKYNSNSFYNTPYTKLLLEIYKLTQNNTQKANLLAVSGDTIFEFENYIFLKHNCSEADFKKYRQRVLSNASYALQSGDLEAFDFYYQVMQDDGNKHKLFELLAKSHDLSFYYLYREIALAANPIEFIVGACYAARFSNKTELVEKLAQYIYETTDSQKLPYFLTDRRINAYSELTMQIKKLIAKK